MDEQLKTDLNIADIMAEYDEHAKNLLAHKIVLAHILSGTVAEFKGMNPEKIVPLIEGEPKVSRIAVRPGETNKGRKITGTSQESKIPNEGMITYDVHFYVFTPNHRERVKIIVDVEAQKQKPAYDLVTRGIFYNARQISAQLGTEFEIPRYNDIKKVYSIWICMNSPEYLENTAVEYAVHPQVLVGKVKDYGKYDLQSVIIINLSKKLAENREELYLHRFLGALLSPDLKTEEKMEILEGEYQIQTAGDMERRMNIMCNLSESIEEKGRAEGRAEERVALALKMLRAGKAEDEILEFKELTKEELGSLKKQVCTA